MNKAYVILEKGFEYDDNIYNEPESGGGNPKLITFTKEEAEQKARELNIKELKQVELCDYSYELEDVLNVARDEYVAFNTALAIKYNSSSEDFEEIYTLHKNADEKESLDYLKMVSIEFFTVVKTDIDLESYRDTKIDAILK